MTVTWAMLIWRDAWWLLSAAAVLGPLFAHWWANRPGRPAVFPAVELLANAQRQPIRWRNIRDLVLLVMRCSVIVLIAMAFAQPAWQRNDASPGTEPRQQRTVAVVLDASGSMKQRTLGSSTFDIAKQQAIAFVRSLDATDDRAIVIIAGQEVRPLWPEPTQRIDALASALNAIRPTDAYVDLTAAVRLAKSRSDAEHVVVFTDGQALAWPTLPIAGTQLQRVLSVDSEPVNAAIESVRTHPGVVVVGRPAHLIATIRNHGAAVIDVRARVEGLHGIEPVAVSIPPGESREAQFTLVARRDGPLDLTVAIDAATDQQPADDSVSLTITPRRAIGVAVPASQPLLARLIEPSSRSPFTITDEDAVVQIVHGSPAAELTDPITDGLGVLVIGPVARADEWLPAQERPAMITRRRLNPASSRPGFLPGFDEASLISLADLPIQRAYRVEPTPGAVVLMRFDDGSPAIIERPFGQGHVIALAFDIDDAMADSPILLPLIHELLHRLIATDSVIARPTLDPRESDLAQLAPVDTMPTAANAARNQIAATPSEPTPLWPWAIAAALALLACEVIVASARSRGIESEAAA